MRRVATGLVLCAFLGLAVGCKNNGGRGLFGTGLFAGGSTATADTSDPYQTSFDSGSYEPATYPVYRQPAPAESTYEASSLVAEPSMPSESMTARYHTVAKRDTLYAIARTYYGDHRRWKDIYEANRTNIGDPNQIRIGQRLLIP